MSQRQMNTNRGKKKKKSIKMETEKAWKVALQLVGSSWLHKQLGDLRKKTTLSKTNSCSYTVVFLLVEPVWCCRKQWQERGIESLGGALGSHLLHSCSLTAPCGQKHPVRARGGRQGLCGHGGVRTLDRAGNWDTSPCPWPRGDASVHAYFQSSLLALNHPSEHPPFRLSEPKAMASLSY